MAGEIQIPIGAGGIDTKTAKEYVDPSTRLLAINNGVFVHDGSVEKRLGCTGITTQSPVPLSAPLRVASRKDEMLMIDGQYLSAYSPTAVTWIPQGYVSPCEITRQPISVTNTAFSLATYYTSFSIAEGHGYRVVVCRDNSQNIYFDLYDMANGATLALKAGTSYVGYAPTVIIMGSIAYLFFSTNVSAGVGTIWGAYLDLTSIGTLSAGWNGPTAIVTNGSTTGTFGGNFVPYEATPEVPSNLGILIIYPRHSLSFDGAAVTTMNYFRLESLPAFTATGSTDISVGYTTEYCTTCCARYDSAIGNVWFGWEIDASGTYTQYAVAYTSAWANVASPFTIFGGSSSNSVLQIEVDFETAIGSSGDNFGVFVAGATGTVQCYNTTSTSEYTYVLGGVYARPFRMVCGPQVHTFVLARAEQAAGYQLALTSISGILFDVSRGGIAGDVAPRQCAFGTVLYDDARLLNVTNVGQTTGVVDILLPTNGSAEFNAGAITATTTPTVAIVNLATFDYTGALPWQPAEGDGETYFSGGLSASYDTKTYQELGWLVWPDGITFVNSTSGGTIPNGTFLYAFVFAYVDNAGLVHRSFPWTVTITTTGSGTSSVIFTIPLTPFTLHYAPGRQPVVEVYRSDTGLTTLYYLSGVNFEPSGTATVSFTDNNSLFSASNVLVYTTGGVLPSVNAPALRCKIRHVERLWGIDDTGLNIWYSQPFNGVDAPYFNEALTLNFTDQILTALGEMDDKLLVFSATSVWYVEGQGPGTNGQGSDLNVAVQIPSDVGANDWRSVVSFPGGVFFQAPSGGIYLLDRGLSITFKGKDVQDITSPTNVGAVTVLSATLVADGTTVRFVLSSGVVLIYNYFFDRWSTASFPQPGAGVGAPFGNATTSCMAAGVWTAGTNQGIVIQENHASNATAHFDTASSGSSSWVPESITLAWIKPGGIQGWSQVDMVQGLARTLDPCDLTIGLSYDYTTAGQEFRYYTYAELAAQNPNMTQWRIGPAAANMQPEAISVTLIDAPPTGGSATTGAGVMWLGVAISVTPLGSIYDKLGAGVKQ